MSRIFIIEDDPSRRAVFRKRFPDHQVDICWDFMSAKSALNGQKYDVAYFDYDLGGDKGKGKARTGADIARYLVESVPKAKWPDYAVVHAENPDGAREIFMILSFAGLPVRVEKME